MRILHTLPNVGKRNAADEITKIITLEDSPDVLRARIYRLGLYMNQYVHCNFVYSEDERDNYLSCLKALEDD